VVININQGFEEFSGFKRDEVIGKSIYELSIYENNSDRKKMLTRISEEGFCKNMEIVYRRKNGDKVTSLVSAEIIALNNSPHVVSIIRDITDRKNVENALKNSEEKYRFLTEYASDVIWVFNLAQNKFTYVSPSMYSLLGLTAEEFMNESLDKSILPESIIVIKNAISKSVGHFKANQNKPDIHIIEIQQKCKNGDIIWVEISAKYRYNSEGDIEIVGVSRNIEERKKTEKEIKNLSYHDQLTGLYNRRYYEEELKRLNTKRNYPLALIMADVNGLKLMNDAFGHKTGDTLLRKIADILKASCRADEIIARIGGDEFIILLPKTDASIVNKILTASRRLLKARNWTISSCRFQLDLQ